jgi:3-oxoacyl-[acyl-carrier-protein] synthase-3
MGNLYLKNAVVRFAEVINEGLEANNLSVSNIDMLIPHQANLRISQFIQRNLVLMTIKFIIIFKKYGIIPLLFQLL